MRTTSTASLVNSLPTALVNSPIDPSPGSVNVSCLLQTGIGIDELDSIL